MLFFHSEIKFNYNIVFFIHQLLITYGSHNKVRIVRYCIVPVQYTVTYSTYCNFQFLPSSSSSVDKDHHHHIGSGGIGSGPKSSGSVLSGQSALMEIEKLLLKFDGIVI